MPISDIHKKHRLAIFASGAGSNARQLIAYFRNHPEVEVGLVVSNRTDAPVLDMAAAHGVPTLYVSRATFYDSQTLLDDLHNQQINFIVLAGFLWLIPSYLVEAYTRKIVNIHPALLPAFGGKGMYGMRVHEAVKQAGATQTGITIHWVNDHYDEGQIIFQAQCPVEPQDTPEDIAHRVLKLEHLHFAPVVEQLLQAT